MLSVDHQRGTIIGDALGAAVEFERSGSFSGVTG
jgi:ADP-ribosylglycohydrolase